MGRAGGGGDGAMAERVSWAAMTRRGALRVPQITAAFWITVALVAVLVGYPLIRRRPARLWK